MTALLDLTGFLEDGFNVDQSSISELAAHTDYSTVLVALAAGVAAMLSFETRASTAVGVAISVTTIPASAYLGVAFGSGDAAEGLGALLVLAVNVVLLIVSGTATLFVQRRLGRKAAQRERAARRLADPVAELDVLVGRQQDHALLVIHRAQHQHLGANGPDLARREVHHRHHQPPLRAARASSS